MERNTFSPLFFIRRKQLLKNGKASIYLRITVNRQRAEMSTSLNTDPDLWNSKKGLSSGRSTTADELNNELEKLRLRIYKIKGQLEEKNLPITAQAIIDLLQGNTKENAGIVELFQVHNDKCRQLINKDYAPATITRYDSTLKHLKEFIYHKYKTPDRSIRLINYEFIKEFEFYLKTKKPPCGHNSTIKYIRNFKKIIREAYNNGWIQIDPFRNIKYSYNEIERDYLTNDELLGLIAEKFDIERLQNVKDIFVFSCFTGLAYAEVKELSKENIKPDNDGIKWIEIKRRKTGKIVRFPLPDIATAILDKYKNNPVCIIHNILLPVLSNQKMNAYLKEIADMCGIKKQITFHTARHTCASTVELATGVPIDNIRDKLGHSSISMTEHYAKVGDPRKKAFLHLINTKYAASLLEKPKDNGNLLRFQAN